MSQLYTHPPVTVRSQITIQNYEQLTDGSRPTLKFDFVCRNAAIHKFTVLTLCTSAYANLSRQ